MSNPDADPILLDEHDGVLVITLNRPHARNAVDAAMARAAAAALDRLESRDDLRVGIITGAGGTFCAGMDLKGFLRGESVRVGDRGFMGLCQHTLAKPLIAAVEGHALAGGLETVLACDLVVSARDARFGISEVRRGLAATSGGLYRLPRKVPLNLAMEMALTGEAIDAVRAAAIGLVNRLTDKGEALAQARVMAATIAANAPLAVAASKRVIVAQQDWLLDEIVARQDEITGHLRGSEDAREGAAAFAEKRPARWRGR
jgi:enoyl-CoA hydratase